MPVNTHKMGCVLTKTSAYACACASASASASATQMLRERNEAIELISLLPSNTWLTTATTKELAFLYSVHKKLYSLKAWEINAYWKMTILHNIVQNKSIACTIGGQNAIRNYHVAEEELQEFEKDVGTALSFKKILQKWSSVLERTADITICEDWSVAFFYERVIIA